MRLTKADKEQLKVWGHEEKDMRQLQDAANRTTYSCAPNGSGDCKRIGVKKAIEILGREKWLSGISRSAFHWTCARSSFSKTVYFDSSKIFE